MKVRLIILLSFVATRTVAQTSSDRQQEIRELQERQSFLEQEIQAQRDANLSRDLSTVIETRPAQTPNNDPVYVPGETAEQREARHRAATADYTRAYREEFLKEHPFAPMQIAPPIAEYEMAQVLRESDIEAKANAAHAARMQAAEELRNLTERIKDLEGRTVAAVPAAEPPAKAPPRKELVRERVYYVRLSVPKLIFKDGRKIENATITDYNNTTGKITILAPRLIVSVDLAELPPDLVKAVLDKALKL